MCLTSSLLAHQSRSVPKRLTTQPFHTQNEDLLQLFLCCHLHSSRRTLFLSTTSRLLRMGAATEALSKEQNSLNNHFCALCESISFPLPYFFPFAAGHLSASFVQKERCGIRNTLIAHAKGQSTLRAALSASLLRPHSAFTLTRCHALFNNPLKFQIDSTRSGCVLYDESIALHTNSIFSPSFGISSSASHSVQS